MGIEGETHTSARVADWRNVGEGLGVVRGKRIGRGIVVVGVAVEVGTVAAVVAVVVVVAVSSVVVAVVVASGVGSVGIEKRGSGIGGPGSKSLCGNLLVLHVPVLVTVEGRFAV